MERHPAGIMTQTRLTSIDALRGLASLAVVLWHWQHFFPPGSVPADHYPMFQLLWPLYQYGRWGVELFFTISGFIFFWLYAEPVAAGRVGGWTFAVLRFSRLYPLHVAALLFVAVVQYLHRSATGDDFIYNSNSPIQFVQQLLLLSAWDERSYTFNGPTWSVVVEVSLYAMFFCLAKLRLATLPAVAAICAVMALLLHGDAPLVRGMHSFFLGGLCALLIREARSPAGLPRAAWFYLPAVIACLMIDRVLAPNGTIVEFIAYTFLFPVLVALAVMFDEPLRPLSSRLEWLGNISYSSYLLHFPLQLTIVTAAAMAGLSVDYLSPLTLTAFMVVLIALSLCCYHWFERPALDALRRHLLARDPRLRRAPAIVPAEAISP